MARSDDSARDAASLAGKVLGGDRLSAARLMRIVDDRLPGYEVALDAIYPHTGKAHVVGIAGSPGCGKSTVVDGLVAAYREAGRRVGVVAVDPSSSITGGALLGDRVRMQRHAGDTGVFIRSLATRGAMGGVSSSTQDIARIMEAMGCEVVLVETVGVGQDEVEITSVAGTVVVVLSPDTGDAVQIMKAGIMEIGDVFAVNKMDRPGADAVARELVLFFQTGARRPAPPVVEMAAVKGEGIGTLADAIAAHAAPSADPAARCARLRAEIRRRLAEHVLDRLDGSAGGGMDAALASVIDGGRSPYAAVRELYERL